MILRRIEEGAAKCALRDLRREEETSATDNTQSEFHLHRPESVIQSPGHPSNQDFHLFQSKLL